MGWNILLCVGLSSATDEPTKYFKKNGRPVPPLKILNSSNIIFQPLQWHLDGKNLMRDEKQQTTKHTKSVSVGLILLHVLLDSAYVMYRVALYLCSCQRFHHQQLFSQTAVGLGSDHQTVSMSCFYSLPQRSQISREGKKWKFLGEVP